MILLALLAALPLIGIAAIAILNTFTFPRLRPSPPPASPPRISVLIPARDEARVIAETTRAWLAQDYPNLEVILLDDHSSDGTAAIADHAAAGDPRLRILRGAPLPPSWMGKSWACHQLSQAATGDLLLFTDADVAWRPNALSALAALQARTCADLLTVWSTQVTITLGERLVVPLMALVILGYLPALAVHHLPFASMAAANGQCLLFRRKAYQQIGGHVAVRSTIVEDITFARRIKRAGLRLRAADGAGMVVCRMYESWAGVRDGYAKNIIAGYGGVIGLLLGTIFHWLVFLMPPIWLLIGWALPAHEGYPLIPLLLTVLGITIRALTAAASRQRLLDALAMPLSALLMTRIAAQALYWRIRYGGVRWKGRTIRA